MCGGGYPRSWRLMSRALGFLLATSVIYGNFTTVLAANSGACTAAVSVSDQSRVGQPWEDLMKEAVLEIRAVGRRCADVTVEFAGATEGLVSVDGAEPHECITERLCKFRVLDGSRTVK